jgi:ArsR family transcriptional regulator
MPTPTDNLIIAGFHALSDPIRVSVIELLRQCELCVCDLCDALHINQSKLSLLSIKLIRKSGNFLVNVIKILLGWAIA